MDKCSRFFGGLRREIQDVLDYKNRLDFPSYIIMLLKLKGKYRDDNLGVPRIRPLLHVQPR